MASCLTFCSVTLFVQSQIAAASQQWFTYGHKQDFYFFSKSFFSWCICYCEHFFAIHIKDVVVKKKEALCIKRIVTHNDFKILGKCVSLILFSIWAFKCIVMWKGQWKDYILGQFGVVNVSTLFLHLKENNCLDRIKKREIICISLWTKGEKERQVLFMWLWWL